MKRIYFILILMTFAAWAEFRTVDAETVIKMQKSGVPLIDIRTPAEWQERGIIPGAHLIMFFDAQGHPHIRQWMEKFSQLVPDKNRPFILYCAHANRSKALGKWLSEKLGYKKVYELKGGIEYGWRELGKPVIKPKNNRVTE
ncbi:rhodanese-like domain-containing protein [Nitratifractor salsuginis]|uniref:Rhodanese domain protein n=1 Tax=Nitratifractor salsuginis (strain DSM 16511 / JCM 12458 / E9I37-1) TaxID=749222 RepID=E6WZB0_NITSE|nr:rhodanese-like domain-containing protein [Nitratifractor salsuginis]ADV46622.1 Rhodanese domain protein [Nitratifractor salsuginis DSM 16511]